uniref:Exocyst complex component EXOC6/Sec15 N-terminal domain-containing protein n=1 Tax=Pseudonaja textilis TaxID=8673 RepID=A0A670ZJW3_PSETE
LPLPKIADKSVASEEHEVLPHLEASRVKHGRFMEKLDARIRNHDREIEKMCNFHYQGFVDSITEFLKVRAEAQKLKVRDCGGGRGVSLVGAMEELRQCRLQQWNISATVDKLSQCLPVLEMESKLREQMKSKRHYPALKTLEHLERMCLPQVNHYRFCKVMVENIPRLPFYLLQLTSGCQPCHTKPTGEENTAAKDSL